MLSLFIIIIIIIIFIIIIIPSSQDFSFLLCFSSLLSYYIEPQLLYRSYINNLASLNAFFIVMLIKYKQKFIKNKLVKFQPVLVLRANNKEKRCQGTYHNNQLRQAVARTPRT